MKIKNNRPTVLQLVIREGKEIGENFRVLPTWTEVPEKFKDYIRTNENVIGMIDSGRLSLVDDDKPSDADLINMIKSEDVLETIEELASQSESERVKKAAESRSKIIKKRLEPKEPKE